MSWLAESFPETSPASLTLLNAQWDTGAHPVASTDAAKTVSYVSTDAGEHEAGKDGSPRVALRFPY
jgi:hypothetical protein